MVAVMEHASFPRPAEPFDPDALTAALEAANLPTLLAWLAHFTGDDVWIEEPFKPGRAQGLDDNDDGGFSDEIQERIRTEAHAIISAWGRGEAEPAEAPAPERIARIMGVALATRVSADYGELMAEELGIVPRAAELPPAPTDRPFRVAIIGAGLSGLCAAIQLQRAGIDYVVYEKNEEVGGTWFENTYPGCGVDTPSALYSYSFAQRSDWSRYFVQRDELFRYYRDIATEEDVREQVRFNTEVTAATWDEDGQVWRLDTSGPEGPGAAVANVVISAVGQLNRPSVPHLPGLDTFEGPAVHTADWGDGVDLRGKRVAVIGTGASAMQLVPAIVDEAAHVTVFQRSPQWAVPQPNYHREPTADAIALRDLLPYYRGWYRLRQFWVLGDRIQPMLHIDPEWPDKDRSINKLNAGFREMLEGYIRHQLKGRDDLLEKSLPSYPPYGKRPLVDNGWYRTIRRDDVELVTDDVAEIRTDRVVTSAGTEHPADVIVLATGFQSLRILGPMEIHGRSGAELREEWGEDDARAYLGITVRDLPNFFCIFGPNTNTGHGGTVILPTEFQVRYALDLVGRMIREDVASVEVKPEVHDRYNDELDVALDRTIWTHPGMTTYYRNSRGRIVTNSPWTYLDYWQRTRTSDLGEYDLVPVRRDGDGEANGAAGVLTADA